MRQELTMHGELLGYVKLLSWRAALKYFPLMSYNMGCIIYINSLWFNIMILNMYLVQVCSNEFSLSFCVMALLINLFFFFFFFGMGNIKFH
jgi:hypothetical protein